MCHSGRALCRDPCFLRNRVLRDRVYPKVPGKLRAREKPAEEKLVREKPAEERPARGRPAEVRSATRRPVRGDYLWRPLYPVSKGMPYSQDLQFPGRLADPYPETTPCRLLSRDLYQ